MKRITDRLGPVNTNSPKQLGDALVEKLKVKLPKTKTGQYSTNVWDLTLLAPKYPVVQDILDFRAVDKIITTYIDAVLEKVDQEGRIHPQYDLMSAATGRLASHDPNIQSTPIGPPYGDKIRSTFVAPAKAVLIAFDYSQQELRILAHLSKDQKLKDAFEKGHDVHQITASRIFDIPKGKVPKELRNIGKTVNFGIIYGQTPYGLSAQLGKSVEECTHILKVYFETYPGVKHYFDNLLIFAKLHGYVETMLGRRRGIPGLPYGKPAKYITQAQERVLKNFPIQGSAADMTKKAMVAIADHVLPKYPDAVLVMQIHDELVFEYHSENEAKIEIFAIAVEQCMKDALPLDVPVVVDWKAGGNWGEI
jgi:DNA polymerase-1